MKKYLMILTSIVFLVFIGCEDRTDTIEPVVETGNASFAKYVSIGNSLTAGYQSSSLYQSAQEYSYPNLIAQQVGADFVQPLISDPGSGGRLEFDFATQSVVANSAQGSPINTSYNGIYNNLGVPGAILADVLLTTSGSSTQSGAVNPLFDVVLRGQGTMVGLATSAAPSFLTCWIGNNDILGHATSGGTLPFVPTATFNAVYTQLGQALAATGAKVVVANIPPVTAIPFFTTVGPGVGLAIQQLQAAGLPIPGLVYAKSSTPGDVAVASVADLISGNVLITLTGSSSAGSLGSGADPFGFSPTNPWPDAFVVDPDELSNINSVIDSYNSSIQTVASANGFGLVDVNGIFGSIASNGGVMLEGKLYTTAFVSGGLFSLDGVHPTNHGAVLIANAFIDVINSKYSANIAHVDITKIPGSIDLAKKNVIFDKFGIPRIPEGSLDNLLF